MKLFKIRCDNKYRVPLLDNREENNRYLVGKEWHSLREGWHPLPFSFYADPKDIKKGWNKQPDICIYHEGLFIRVDLISVIFPEKPVELELLPILIDGEHWMLLNCLKTTKDYDPEQSKFYRSGENQQIYMIKHLVLYDSSVEPIGLFTLEDSNRAGIFVTESFVERINKLGLKGVEFNEIGVLEPRQCDKGRTSD
ncbi:MULTISPECIES: hypothetical protein [Methylomicrobium]|uniref:Uncharacterized protein n=1 Tax=Methylomicrobium album BG8 TaxID=686340 RepID=H8GI19_METAL|nr:MULTISPECIES: hypothetical protein [Methylomicrobium]EIC30163.1 hypothetical protein Metal_2441 [Methylomicrobium album BG8]